MKLKKYELRIFFRASTQEWVVEFSGDYIGKRATTMHQISRFPSRFKWVAILKFLIRVPILLVGGCI